MEGSEQEFPPLPVTNNHIWKPSLVVLCADGYDLHLSSWTNVSYALFELLKMDCVAFGKINLSSSCVFPAEIRATYASFIH